jgi:hypothetical protein
MDWSVDSEPEALGGRSCRGWAVPRAGAATDNRLGPESMSRPGVHGPESMSRVRQIYGPWATEATVSRWRAVRDGPSRAAAAAAIAVGMICRFLNHV